MKQPGPIFAMVPASIGRVDCALPGTAFTLTTYGLILAHEGVALIQHLDPTTMLALGMLMTRAGTVLGGDTEAAISFLRGADQAEAVQPVQAEVQHDANLAH